MGVASFSFMAEQDLQIRGSIYSLFALRNDHTC